MKSLFTANRKLLIGVVHLLPLPGSPRWQGNLEQLIEFAVNDADSYERGDADAVCIENFGDVPFTKSSVAPETIAAMAAPSAPKLNYPSASTSCATTPAPHWPCAPPAVEILSA